MERRPKAVSVIAGFLFPAAVIATVVAISSALSRQAPLGAIGVKQTGNSGIPDARQVFRRAALGAGRGTAGAATGLLRRRKWA